MSCANTIPVGGDSSLSNFRVAVSPRRERHRAVEHEIGIGIDSRIGQPAEIPVSPQKRVIEPQVAVHEPYSLMPEFGQPRDRFPHGVFAPKIEP